jgi:hypothetical protein
VVIFVDYSRDDVFSADGPQVLALADLADRLRTQRDGIGAVKKITP